MSGEDTFLGRWSRRKQDAARSEPVAAESPDLPRLDRSRPALSRPDLAQDKASAIAEPIDEVSLAERIASLPSIADIGELTDMKPFMQPWVPSGLRTQALRKLWTVDRAVREHVIFADYALDYNAPGGAPGYGAFESSIEMVKRALDSFSRDPAANEPETPVAAQSPRPQVEENERIDSAESAAPSTPAQHCGADESLDLRLIEESSDMDGESSPPASETAPLIIAVREEPVSAAPLTLRRRHGSAAPR